MPELIKARLHKYCTYCGCETLKSHHNSLMCDACPPHRAHGHLFVLLGKCFHVLTPDSRHTDVTVNVSINGKIDVDVNSIC